MKYIVQAVGMLLVFSSVWLRAQRRMTVNHTAFWGMTGILLIVAGAVPGLFDGMGALDVRKRILMCILGAAVWVGGMTVSVFLSRLSIEKKEQAIRRSMLLQEKEKKKVFIDQEVQTPGCAVIASDCDGSREQILQELLKDRNDG